MSKHFAHIHLHTDYSLLDGAITIEKLIAYGKDNNFQALAISDHGNIFGAVKFFQKATKAGIKPILGMEAYLTEDASIKNAENKYYHLILLVENEIGYKNLCRLIAFSFEKGFYFKPRIDYNVLQAHSEGLIATSACLGGHIPQLLIKNQPAQAEKQMDWFLQTFGEDRFYLEVQPEDQKEQKILNTKLFEYAQKKGIGLVATGDCHYPSPEDHYAHEVMLCIGTHGQINDPQRYTFGDCRVHMRNAQQMLEAFPNHHEAVWNSGIIADRCSFEFPTGKLFFPKFEIPEKYTQESYFRHLCQQGFDTLVSKQRIDEQVADQYQKRLELEMKLIVDMGFIGYFLIVSDFIQWAKRNAIPVGPGRGSAAGSLVAWALEVTDIDPIKYNLLFERFLNPERITMPDIDIDFCIEGREKVINYVRDRYGHDKVCQIITFGTMMAKGVIKDVARVLGFPFEDSNAITKLIPDQLKITLAEAIEQEPRLKEMIDSSPRVKQLFDIAFRLEGVTRHASKHAAGIVVTPEPVAEMLPLYVPAKTTDLVTQYAMSELESLGFLKIDFLGLKNLTLVDRTIAQIKHNHNTDVSLQKLPLDNALTFELLCQGKTSGVFQLESSGLKEVLRKLQPEKFEDIIAVNALYRPGPLGSGMVDDFIERKHGRQKITYLFDELEPILKETYGVIVYQEQVMKIASAIAGYSLGEADILRRAMGKKKVDVMTQQRKLFLERSQKRGFDQKRAGELFDLMAFFAGYGFNKSHSAAYAMIAYQTAYLKANYPAEFMASLISLEANNAEKMAFYLNEAKEMHLTLLPPDINNSEIMFSVRNESLLFGLEGIKNIGQAALEAISVERKKKPFADIFDLCKRIDLRTVNKRVLENLISAGALDCLPGNRAQKHEELPQIMQQAVEQKKAERTGQMALFGTKKAGSVEGPYLYEFTTRHEWDNKTKLEKEREVIGFYVSSHPIDSYSEITDRLSYLSFETITKKTQATQQELYVTACGLLQGRKDIITKKGDRMSFLQLEDKQSHAEIVVFPSVYKTVSEHLDQYQVFVVVGNTDAQSDICKIKAQYLIPLETMFQESHPFSFLECTLPKEYDPDRIKQLLKDIPSGRTTLIVRFNEADRPYLLDTNRKVSVTLDMMEALRKENILTKCYI